MALRQASAVRHRTGRGIFRYMKLDWVATRPVIIIVAILMIFMADCLTLADGLASSLYILILVSLAETQECHELFGYAALCICLTFITYPIAHGLQFLPCPLFRREVSSAALLFAIPVIRHNILLQHELSTLDRFLEITNHPIIIRDQSDLITFWNGAAERLYGRHARAVLGKNFFAITGRAAPATPSTTPLSVTATTKHGARVNLLCRSLAVRNFGGRETRLEIETDITAIEQGSAKLRQSEARFRSIFNIVESGFLELDVTDLLNRLSAEKENDSKNYLNLCKTSPKIRPESASDVQVLDLNDSLCRMLGAPDKTSILNENNLISYLFTEKNFYNFAAALLDKKERWQAVNDTKTLQGHPLSLLINARFFYGEKSTKALISLADETSRKKIQTALTEVRHGLQQANQITALGGMTAAIAHQLNHPLAAIIANAEAGLRWLGRPAPDHTETLDAIIQIIRNTQTAGEISTSLHDSAPVSAVTFDLCSSIGNIIKLLAHELTRHKITLEQVMPHPPLFMHGDRVQIEQMLVNLLANAVEAMAGMAVPGEIVIRATHLNAGTLCLQIEDSGPGMRGLSEAQLFEPLYTTKSSGTGLGLPICRAIILRHNGKISLSTAASGGMIATVTLPVCHALAEKQLPIPLSLLN